MPLAQAGEAFIFSDLPSPAFKRLPAHLADAQPDDFGNALIDARNSIITLFPGRDENWRISGDRGW